MGYFMYTPYNHLLILCTNVYTAFPRPYSACNHMRQQDFRLKIQGQNILFTSEAQIHKCLFPMKAMQYDVSTVTESFKIFTTTITVIVITVPVLTFIFIKQCTIFSTTMGISEATFLKILYNCLVFHSTCLFS